MAIAHVACGWPSPGGRKPHVPCRGPNSTGLEARLQSRPPGGHRKRMGKLVLEDHTGGIPG